MWILFFFAFMIFRKNRVHFNRNSEHVPLEIMNYKTGGYFGQRGSISKRKINTNKFSWNIIIVGHLNRSVHLLYWLKFNIALPKCSQKTANGFEPVTEEWLICFILTAKLTHLYTKKSIYMWHIQQSHKRHVKKFHFWQKQTLHFIKVNFSKHYI